jgi:NADH-quinone oxidoreductase subunit E
MIKGELMEIDAKKLVDIIEKNGRYRNALIPILQDIQNEYNWLPKETFEIVARELELPLMDVYGVATFYRTFSLKPRGEHIVTVCLGTACHVRGGQRVADTISGELKIKPGETTVDMKFTLETVNCLGACALGPVVVIDSEYYGQMTKAKASLLIKNLKKDEGSKEDE